MSHRVRIFVTPLGSHWKVSSGSSEYGMYTTKPAAIQRGRELAIANQPSQLIIQRQDGTIEDERTYGSDPFPPRG